MRTIYCCPYCGSSHLYYDAWSAINWEDTLTFDAMQCLACDRAVSNPIEVEVAEDVYVVDYVHNVKEEN